ncbi:hypothetical protein CDAR_261741 [Caerostris darwini]|uniref:Uncharacterized protein n=1 Tax=Caerostris darwini TaxID=1538125 RepID=A0AAV4V1F9_9ARAC|nr:hypothetical protein CDAR_261741 [Caerostris darwini]
MQASTWGNGQGIKRGGSNFLINSLIFTLSYFIGCASHLTDVQRTLTHLPAGIGPLACELVIRFINVTLSATSDIGERTTLSPGLEIWRFKNEQWNPLLQHRRETSGKYKNVPRLSEGEIDDRETLAKNGNPSCETTPERKGWGGGRAEKQRTRVKNKACPREKSTIHFDGGGCTEVARGHAHGPGTLRGSGTPNDGEVKKKGVGTPRS